MRSFFPYKRQRQVPKYHDIYPTPVPRRSPRVPRIRPFVAVILIAGILAGGLWTRTAIRADTLTLHPTACLGGWKNPERAQGPLTANAAEVEGFTDAQSATLEENTIAEMFCGGFAADIPPRSTPKTLTLLVAWSTVLAAEPSTPVVSGEDFASSSKDILDAPQGTEPSFKLTEPPVNELPASEPPAHETEPAAPQDPAPTAKPILTPVPSPDPAPSEPAPAPEPLSFLQRLIPTAHAQEVPDQAATVVEAPTPTPAAETTPAEPEPAPQEGSVVAPAEDPPSTITNTEIADNAFLEVRYTLNGIDWRSLGTYDAAHVVPMTFSIPLPKDSSWSDLSSFQISVRSRAVLDSAPAVYLDGMELRIGYDDKSAPFYTDKTVYSTDDMLVITSSKPRSFVEVYFLDESDQTASTTTISTTTISHNVYGALVGDDNTVSLETKTLVPGRFILVNTEDPEHCNEYQLQECRAARGYLAETEIRILTFKEIAALATSTPSKFEATRASTTTADGSTTPPAQTPPVDVNLPTGVTSVESAAPSNEP